MKFLLTICFLFPFLLSAAEYAFETESGRKVTAKEIKIFNGCKYTLTNGEEIWVYELKNPDCFRVMFGDKTNWKTMKKYPECYVVMADARGCLLYTSEAETVPRRKSARSI